MEQIRKNMKTLVDAAVNASLADKKTAGIVTHVKVNGETVYHGAAGFADREKAVPATKETLFRLASITKAFTSLGVAALIEKGDVKLTDPVTKFLPWFTPAAPDGSKPAITISQLLSHTGGLDYRWSQTEDGPYATAGVTDALDVTGLTLEENMHRVASCPLKCLPGTDFYYSLSPDLLGLVISTVCGKPFDQALNDILLKPMGLSDAMFFVDDEDAKRLAKPYFLDKSGMLTVMGKDEYLTSPDGRYFHFAPARVLTKGEFASGGCGLVSTASDLMVLVESIRTDTNPVVSSSLMATMSADVLDNRGIVDRPGMGFCLGWGILRDPDAADNTPQAAGTRMWGGVYGTSWFADRSKNLSAVILTNTALDDVVKVDIRNAIYKALA